MTFFFMDISFEIFLIQLTFVTLRLGSKISAAEGDNVLKLFPAVKRANEKGVVAVNVKLRLIHNI